MNGSYTITPSKSGFVFTPPSRTVTVSGANVAAVDFTVAPVPTFSVSGTVSPAAGGSGATLTLSGAASATLTADGSGNYSFSGLLNGSYTVTPGLAGYTFTPASLPVTVSGANVSAVNFTAQPVTISGAITPAAIGTGAIVTLAGPVDTTATADGAGAFTFSGLPNGTYTVTPAAGGVAFTPASRTVVIAGGVSASGMNFTAASTLTVSGTISSAANGTGTTLTMTGGATATANSSGNYTFAAVPNGTYTVTPSKIGFTFTPASQTVTVNGANVSAVNFTAQMVTISGTITPAASGAGATVALAGSATSASTTADAGGAYSFGALPDGVYTVTPSKIGFTFTPASRTVTITGASAASIDFTATAVPIYLISGTVSPGANGNGATLTLSGSANRTATADASGSYSFSGLANGFVHGDAEQVRLHLHAGEPVDDGERRRRPGDGLHGAAGHHQRHDHAGSSGGAGATVTLAGPVNTTVTSDAAGVFSFSGLPNGTYTVAPSKAGTTFTPSSRSVTIANGVSVGGVDFSVFITYSISGTVSPAAGLAGALIGVGESAVTVDAGGNYNFGGLPNGTYLVTPTKPGYNFTPVNQTIVISNASVVGVNFTAQAVTVSGTITPAANASGALVMLNAGLTTTVDAAGGFTVSGVPNGTYTVTLPSKSGFTFTPASQSVTVIAGASVSGINFTATTASTGAITIDVNKTAGKSPRVQTIASGAFTTTAGNELLLAFVEASNVDAGATTVTGITGGSLTWTLVRRTNTQRGTSEIWRAFAPAVLTNATVTATLSQFAASSITVMSFKGADTTGTGGSGAIGATGSANALTGAPSASLVTTRNNSFVLGGGQDWDGATARTLGAGQTLVSQFLGTDGDTFWVQRTTNAVAAAGTTVTINDTAPPDHRYNLTIVEILPAIVPRRART